MMFESQGEGKNRGLQIVCVCVCNFISIRLFTVANNIYT